MVWCVMTAESQSGRLRAGPPRHLTRCITPPHSCSARRRTGRSHLFWRSLLWNEATQIIICCHLLLSNNKWPLHKCSSAKAPRLLLLVQSTPNRPAQARLSVSIQHDCSSLCVASLHFSLSGGSAASLVAAPRSCWFCSTNLGSESVSPLSVHSDP